MTVYLVGAGPGDPGLITARGLELLRSCDVLVYDRLVSDDLVAEAPDDALRVSRDRFEQAELSAVLVSLGRRDLDVVRLKGGDPFLFGRGGEEALALAQAGVGFEVVPGVSALHAVPAASGIPITHRGVASQVTIVSGHEPEALDLAALAAAPGTLVVFMGLEALPTLVDRLLEAGRAPDTRVAVISKGTTAEQESVVSRLDEIAEAAAHLMPLSPSSETSWPSLRHSLLTTRPNWPPARRREARRVLTRCVVTADNKTMLKAIRDLWGRATQKKKMKPEVRNMLLDLDGVYERREPVVPQHGDEQDDESREAAG